VGGGAGRFAAGERVAISPSRPCGLCRHCQQGLQNHCLDMRYYGSAMRTPHVLAMAYAPMRDNARDRNQPVGHLSPWRRKPRSSPHR
jgi:threonine dehydrogenase-like Zn-dependent dehydrogenase